MTIKLDKDIRCFIENNYTIDSSIFKEIEERRQLLSEVEQQVIKIRKDAPEELLLPVDTDNIIESIINKQKFQLKINKNQLKIIEDQIKLLDVFVDKVDKIVAIIDNNCLSIVNLINNKIKNVADSYDNIIGIGCSSELIWDYIKDSTSIGPTGVGVSFRNYRVIKNPNYRREIKKYGLKIYQKPSNIDYGYKISSQFKGNIGVGKTVLGVVSLGGTSGINLNDTITDDFTSPTIFSVGDLPEVVGFGTTSILKTTNIIYGNISLGSTIIAFTGIGNTLNININDYVINIEDEVYTSDSKVVGFGTTTTTVISSGVSTNIVVESIIIDKPSIGVGTETQIGFGSYFTYPSLLLNKTAFSSIENKTFYSIQDNTNSDLILDFTQNPNDPIKISILNPKSLGEGNEIIIINNGESPETQMWNTSLNEPEPEVGYGVEVYYVGRKKWPILSGGGYAKEGKIYKFNYNVGEELGELYYTDTSPNENFSEELCDFYYNQIEVAEEDLKNTKKEYLPKLETFLSWSKALRMARNNYEIQLWSYKQSLAFFEKEIKSLEENIGENGLSGIDMSALES